MHIIFIIQARQGSRAELVGAAVERNGCEGIIQARRGEARIEWVKGKG